MPSIVDTNSQVTFRNVTGHGGKQWVSFHYTVSNHTGKSRPPLFSVYIAVLSASRLINAFSWSTAGEAHVLVNDHPIATNISAMNSRAGHHKTVPIELDLKEGDGNVITFGANGSESKSLR